MVDPSSVAVLYFDNLSRDSGDVFLADGLTEELIIRLSQVRRLEVRSRFESQRFRGRAPGDPAALGRTLRAAYLVTGSLQQAGQRVRLRVALVRAASGTQVWGDVYDRAGQDMLAIQSDIASAVAGAITGQLLPAERATLARRPTSDPIAYDLYLRGVGAANTTSEGGLRTGLDLFDRAIARDSSFADAWAQKALAWTMMADGYMEGRAGFTRAREAASRAVRLDSSQALASAILSQAAVALDLDPRAGLALGRRAVSLNPRDPLSHAALAAALLLAGAIEESLAEIRRGWETDTLSSVTAYLYLWHLHRAGRADSLALVLARMRATLAPEDVRHWEGVLHLLRGDAAGAAQRLTWQYYGGNFSGEYVRALLALGRRDAAAAVLDSILAFERQAYYNPYGIASAYAALGDADHAFQALDQAYEQRTIWLVGLSLDETFAPLRSDPRYPAFLRRTGLAP